MDMDESLQQSFLPEQRDTISVQPIANRESQPVRKWWHIDKRMFRFKLHYFLLTGALGSVLPFIAVIAKNRIQLSATSFATVLAFEQFLFVFTKPAIGYVTDYFNKLKTVLCVVAVGQGVFLFLLLLLPPIPKGVDPTVIGNRDACAACADFSISSGKKISDNSSDEFKSKSWVHWTVPEDNVCHLLNDSSQKLSNVAFPTECRETEGPISSFACPLKSNDSCVVSVQDCILCCNAQEGCHYRVHPPNHADFETHQFWLFALVFVLLNACINAIFTLSDTACCESVQKNGADYGKQRLWGAVGWGLLAPIGGLLTDYTGDYIAVWIVFVILSLLMIWNVIQLNLVKPHFSKDILKNVGTVLREREFLCFEAGVFVNGIGLGFVWFYLMWFVTSLGGTRFLCGLTHSVQCFAGELPFMFFSGWMLRKMGHFHVLSLSLLAYCLRFVWYGTLDDPWLVLPVEWTHGITYGVFYASIATYAKMSAKPGTETTTQSVIFATYDGLGAGVGNIVAGFGFDSIGAHATFFYTGLFFGCCSLPSVCYAFFRGRKKKTEES